VGRAQREAARSRARGRRAGQRARRRQDVAGRRPVPAAGDLHLAIAAVSHGDREASRPGRRPTAALRPMPTSRRGTAPFR